MRVPRVPIVSGIMLIAAMGAISYTVASAPSSPTISSQQRIPLADRVPIPGVPASEAETEAFARDFEAAIAAADWDKFERLVAPDQLALRSISDIEVPRPIRQKALERYWKHYLMDSVDGMRFSRELGTVYRFLQTHSRDDRPSARFRVSSLYGNFDYCDVLVMRLPNGQLILEDMHFDDIRPRMLAEVRDRVLAQILLEKRDFEDQLNLRDVVRRRATVQAWLLVKSIDEDGPRVALNAFHRLPPEIQADPSVMLRYTVAATLSKDPKEVSAARQKRMQLFAGELAADWAELELTVGASRFDDALKVIDRIDRTVGGDPALDVHRVDILARAGRLPEARSLADACIQRDPSLRDGYIKRLHVAVYEGNKADTLRWTKFLLERFAVDLPGLKKTIDFGELLKTSEWAELEEWSRNR